MLRDLDYADGKIILGRTPENSAHRPGHPPPVSRSTAEVVVIGAGIAGTSAAFHLAVREGLGGVVT